jgi:hypothetical protein
LREVGIAISRGKKVGKAMARGNSLLNRRIGSRTSKDGWNR